MENEEIIKPDEITNEKQPNTHKKLKIVRTVALTATYTLLFTSLACAVTACVRTAIIAPKWHEETALIEELGEQSQEFKDTIAFELNDNQNKFLNGEISSHEYENKVNKLNSKEHKRDVLSNVSDVDLTELENLQSDIKIENNKIFNCLNGTLHSMIGATPCLVGTLVAHFAYDCKKDRETSATENKELEV